MSPLRWCGLVVLVVAAGVAGWVIATPAAASILLPAPTGPFHVGTMLFDLRAAPTTPPAQRPLRVRLWYPAAPSSASRQPFTLQNGTTTVVTAGVSAAQMNPTSGPYPVLVFVPGWDGGRDSCMSQMQELASQGFVVAAIDDLYPTTGGFNFGSEAAYQRTLQENAEKTRLMASQVDTMVSFITSLNAADPAGRFTGRLALDQLGIYGFSFGGAVAFETASRDPKFKAVVNMDGWLFGDPLQTWVPQPSLVMTEMGPGGFTPGPYATDSPDPATRYSAMLDKLVDDQTAKGLAAHGGYFLKISGVQHDNFTDGPMLAITPNPPIDPTRADHIVRAYLVQFFQKYLMNRPAPLLDQNATLDPAAHLKIWPGPL